MTRDHRQYLEFLKHPSCRNLVLSKILIRSKLIVLNILAIPLYPLFLIIRFTFRALRVPLPNFGRFTFSYHPFGPGPNHEGRDPNNTAQYWILALEEETGAVCISRSANNRHEQTNSHSVATGIAGSYSLTERGGTWEQGPSRGVEGDLKLLPDFFSGGYKELPGTCQTEINIACVVILSDEDEDVPEFKRSVSYRSSIMSFF